MSLQRGFLSKRKGKVIPCRWTKNRKGAGTNSGESGARNLEAGSIRSRAESTGGCVKLKEQGVGCLLYTSPSPRDMYKSRMPSSA